MNQLVAEKDVLKGEWLQDKYNCAFFFSFSDARIGWYSSVKAVVSHQNHQLKCCLVWDKGEVVAALQPPLSLWIVPTLPLHT